MKWFSFAIFAALFWGSYGTAAKAAGLSFHHASELTILYVCLAYAVLGIPGTYLNMKHDHGGDWTPACRKWGLIAGTSGFLGALFVILAIKVGGNPLIVMAFVFGLAQVFNFLFTWIFAGFKLARTPNVKFIAAFPVLIVATWAVQQFKPGSPGTLGNLDLGLWTFFTLLVAICWGLYGVSARTAVMKSKKQPSDHGSHLRPLFWVSVAYLVFGVVAALYMSQTGVFEKHTIAGAGLGFLVGIFGLGGAAFVIPANSVPGSPGPGVVMAVVFATASAVNAITSWIAFPPD